MDVWNRTQSLQLRRHICDRYTIDTSYLKLVHTNINVYKNRHHFLNYILLALYTYCRTSVRILQ